MEVQAFQSEIETWGYNTLVYYKYRLDLLGGQELYTVVNNIIKSSAMV